MNRAVRDAVMFIAGAAVGYFVTTKLLENKYEKRYQEAVESTKEAYSRRNVVEEYTDNIVAEEDLPSIDEYAKVLKEEEYVDYSTAESVKTEKEEIVDRPYVIAPEEFGEFDEYERISLTYYADGKLTDEDDVLIDDVDEIVGEDSLTQFGVYEDDSVFVRNDAKKCDYEILLDQRNYFDVIKSKQHRPAED
jgi:CO dehydrogenase/acetyl-CoA synthase beta subunit